jgi:hypothetical protein
MTSHLICERHNRREIRNVPVVARKAAKVDHAARKGEHERIHPLEVAYNAIETDTKSRRFELLRGRRPFHVDAEEVAANGFEEMVGDAAKEEEEEWRPLDGFPEALEEGLLAESVPEHGVAKRGEYVEAVEVLVYISRFEKSRGLTRLPYRRRSSTKSGRTGQ